MVDAVREGFDVGKEGVSAGSGGIILAVKELMSVMMGLVAGSERVVAQPGKGVPVIKGVNSKKVKGQCQT